MALPSVYPRLLQVLLSVVQLSEDKSTSWLADVHHTASKCLFGIEGYLSSAPYNINNEDQGFGAQPDTDRVQAVLVLQLELAVWSIEHAHETEQDRQTGEQLRQTGEQARQTGEHLRQIGEQARQNGEQPRQNAEQPRQNGEQARQTGEQNGQTGEQPRQIGEQTRQASVQFRQTGEQPRQVGEEPRQTGEQPRQTGEQTRQNGEEPRQTGEQPRQTGEEPRQTGEEPRQTGEDRAAPDESESALHPLQQLAGHLAAARHHWSQDMFSEECFDASVRQHALRQLAVCIVEASKVGLWCRFYMLHRVCTGSACRTTTPSLLCWHFILCCLGISFCAALAFTTCCLGGLPNAALDLQASLVRVSEGQESCTALLHLCICCRSVPSHSNLPCLLVAFI